MSSQYDYCFSHSDHAPTELPEQLHAARLEGFQHGYSASLRLNLHVLEPWSKENRERNQMYIKGAVEGQDRLRSFLGKNGSPNNLSVDDSQWMDITILGQYMVGFMHGFDSGCVACFCTAGPFANENDTTPAFSYLE